MMKSIANTCFLASSLTVFSANATQALTADDLTCNVWQVCESNKDATPDNPPTLPCADPGKVTVPTMDTLFAPAVMD